MVKWQHMQPVEGNNCSHAQLSLISLYLLHRARQKASADLTSTTVLPSPAPQCCPHQHHSAAFTSTTLLPSPAPQCWPHQHHSAALTSTTVLTSPAPPPDCMALLSRDQLGGAGGKWSRVASHENNVWRGGGTGLQMWGEREGVVGGGPRMNRAVRGKRCCYRGGDLGILWLVLRAVHSNERASVTDKGPMYGLYGVCTGSMGCVRALWGVTSLIHAYGYMYTTLRVLFISYVIIMLLLVINIIYHCAAVIDFNMLC